MRILVLMTNEDVEAMCRETGQPVGYMENCMGQQFWKVPYLNKLHEDVDYTLGCDVEIVTV